MNAFRIALPVRDIDEAVAYFERVLSVRGEWVGAGRVYFHGDAAILVCYDARAEGDAEHRGPNRGYVYVAVDDLDATFDRARQANGEWIEDAPSLRAWGERSFYAHDPSGNPVCFVEASTRYVGESATAEKSGVEIGVTPPTESAAAKSRVDSEEER